MDIKTIAEQLVCLGNMSFSEQARILEEEYGIIDRAEALKRQEKEVFSFRKPVEPHVLQFTAKPSIEYDSEAVKVIRNFERKRNLHVPKSIGKPCKKPLQKRK